MGKPTIVIGIVGLVCILFIAQTPMCAAEQPGTHIEGYLENMGGFPRDGATIVATNTRTWEYLSTTTDQYGEFELDLADLTSGVQIGDIILLNGIEGEVKFLNANFVIETLDEGSWISAYHDLERFAGATTPSVYWGPSHSEGASEEAEEVGEVWGDYDYDTEQEVDVINPPTILTYASGYDVSCDFYYEDSAMYQNVLNYKIVLIFWVTTEAPTDYAPASRTATAPQLVREGSWDDTYSWNEIPYDTGWRTIVVDLDPPIGQKDWYGNARMEVWHWNPNKQPVPDWEFHEGLDFWSVNKLWHTSKSI